MHIKEYDNTNKEEVEEIFKMYWTDQEFLDELSDGLDSNSYKFYTVSSDNEIVGVAGIRKADNFLKEYSTTSNPVELYIIATKYRERGIGSVLCKHIIGECKKMNYTEMLCYSPETHDSSWKFYENTGFVEQGIVNDPDDGYPGMVWKREI